MIVLIVAGFFIPFYTSLWAYSIIFIFMVVPWLGVAMVAVFGQWFTYGSEDAVSTRVSVTPLIAISIIMIAFIGRFRYPVDDVSQIFYFSTAGGGLMTLIALAISPDLRGSWRRILIFLMSASIYVAGATMTINAIFDHAKPSMEFFQIESNYTQFVGRNIHHYYFMVRTDNGLRMRLRVDQQWYAQKKPGDIICQLISPGFLGMQRSWTTECPGSDFSARREALQNTAPLMP